MTKTLRKVRPISGVLFFLIVCGMAFRFAGLNWDGGTHLHPDERFLCMTLPDLGWPHSVGEYFQTDRAPLNPFAKKDVGLFVYGQLPITLVKGISALLGRDNYDDILLVGRALSALCDCGTIAFIFLIGRRIGATQLGLLAAAFLSLTALHIQQAHFFTVDTFAVFFLVASFHHALRWTGTDSHITLRASLFTGLFFGAALACKISSLLFFAPLCGFAFHHFRRVGWKRASREFLLLIFATFVVFRCAHPMAFRGEAKPLTLGGLLDVRLAPQNEGHNFWGSLKQQKDITDGEVDFPPNLQWIGRTNYVFPLRNLILWGTGAPLGISALLGILWIFWRASRHFLGYDLEQEAVSPTLLFAAFWCVLCFLFYGAQFSKFTRYYLQITPFLCLCAAHLLSGFQKYARISAYFRTMVVAATFCWAFAVASIYWRPNTRLAASQWIRHNIAPQAIVANETSWDDTLPIGGPGDLRPLNLELFEPDTLAKRRKMLDVLNRAQWIFISSQRTWQSAPRLSRRYPLASAFYRGLFDGSLGFTARKDFTSYPQILGLKFRDDAFEESLSVYDHPRVALFQKTAKYSAQNAAVLLGEDLARRADDASLAQLRDNGYKPDETTLPQLPTESTP